MSRIDRIYSDLTTIECMDRRITTRTLGRFGATHQFSDHPPVSATIFPADLVPPDTPSIPKWIVKDPMFTKAVKHGLDAVPPPHRLPVREA